MISKGCFYHLVRARDVDSEPLSHPFLRTAAEGFSNLSDGIDLGIIFIFQSRHLELSYGVPSHLFV